jgi:hypothetical protein
MEAPPASEGVNIHALASELAEDSDLSLQPRTTSLSRWRSNHGKLYFIALAFALVFGGAIALVTGLILRPKEDEMASSMFIQKSVMLNVPPDQGTEDIGSFNVDYNVTYNEDGVVVLSKSSDIIDGVVCSSRRVDVLFSKPLTKKSSSSMFPTSAILVVDRAFFGTACNLLPSNEWSQEQTSNIGFFVIESSHIDGSMAIITVTPTIVDSIFEKQSMYYRMISTGERTRRLLSFAGEVKLPPNSIVQFVCKAEATVDISAHFNFTTEMVRLGQIFSKTIYYPKFEMTATADYHMKVKHTNSLRITAGKFKCPGHKACPQPDYEGLLPDIPIAAVPVPGFILKFLNVKGYVKRLGLVVALPLSLELQLETYVGMDINVSCYGRNSILLT